jgi:hypothetical protein
MPTAIVAQFILDALEARIKNLSVFTAYDVTTDARDMTEENVDHTEVRNIVHQEFATSQFPDAYNQESIELTTNDVAIVYFPDGHVASEHPMAKNPTAPPIGKVPDFVKQAQTGSTSVAAPKSKKGGNTKDGDGYICEVTGKNVINIPDAIVKAVTPNGGTYDITTITGVTIYKKADGEGRLRISSSRLGGGDKFRMVVKTNTIVVEQA